MTPNFTKDLDFKMFANFREVHKILNNNTAFSSFLRHEEIHKHKRDITEIVLLSLYSYLRPEERKEFGHWNQMPKQTLERIRTRFEGNFPKELMFEHVMFTKFPVDEINLALKVFRTESLSLFASHNVNITDIANLRSDHLRLLNIGELELDHLPRMGDLKNLETVWAERNKITTVNADQYYQDRVWTRMPRVRAIILVGNPVQAIHMNLKEVFQHPQAVMTITRPSANIALDMEAVLHIHDIGLVAKAYQLGIDVLPGLHA